MIPLVPLAVLPPSVARRTVVKLSPATRRGAGPNTSAPIPVHEENEPRIGRYIIDDFYQETGFEP